MTDNGKVHGIIHSASASAAAAGAGLAQIPGSDNAVITPIQIAMITAIGEVHGVEVTKPMAISALTAASAGVVGRSLSQFMVGWIPGYGNAINASTAFAITQAIGWAVDAMFSEGKIKEE